MNDGQVFVRTPQGDAAVRQNTLQAQPGLFSVLVAVDGRSTVAGLKSKVGGAGVVDPALTELVRQGLIEAVATGQAASVLECVTEDDSTSLDFNLDEEMPLTVPAPENKRLVPEPIEQGDARERKVRVVPGFVEKSRRHLNREPATIVKTGAAPSLFARWRERRDKLQQQRALKREEMAFEQAYAVDGETDVGAKPDIKPIHSRPRRGLFGSLLRFFVFLVAGLGLLALLAFLFPYDRYLPEIEKRASAVFLDPVKITRVGFVILPYPSFTLEGVSVGSEPYANIKAVRVAPDVLSLFGSGRKTLRNVDIEGLRINRQNISRTARWFSGGGGGDILVRRARLEKLVMDFGDANREVVVKGLGGVIQMTPEGRLGKLILTSPDDKLRLEATPTENGYQLAISGDAMELPMEPALKFDYIAAEGEITAGQLRLNKIEAKLYEGHFQGSGQVDWSQGVVMTSNIDFKLINSSKLFAVVNPGIAPEGPISGRIRVESRVTDFAQLLDGLRIDGDFSMSNGAIKRYDLVEAARGGGARGGLTRFEQLSGTLRTDEQAYRIGNLKLNSGMLTAAGSLDIYRNQRVSGLMEVEFKGSTIRVRAPVSIGGTTADPQLRVTR